MTFKVDNDALKVAMMRHYEEKLAKELREMFIYSGNEDTNRIWQLYMEEVERQEQKKRLAAKNNDGEIFLAIFGIGMILYGIWHLLTASPT